MDDGGDGVAEVLLVDPQPIEVAEEPLVRRTLVPQEALEVYPAGRFG